MKKILISLAVIIVVAFVAIVSSLDGIIKKGIEAKAPEILGVNVSVANVSVSILSGSAQIDGFVIGNPEGFKSDKAFYLGKVKVGLNLPSLLSDTIVINEVHISNPEISYEIGLRGANINRIMKNIGSGGTMPAETEAENASVNADKPDKQVVINDLYIQGAKVKAAIGAASQSIALPDIHLSEIGKKGQALSFAKASEKVIVAVIDEVSKQDLNSIIVSNIESKLGDTAADIKDNLKEGVKDIGKSLKGIFE